MTPDPDLALTLHVPAADLAAVLERARQRHFWALAPHAGPATVLAALDDIPLLVAAVEKVLKPHQPGRIVVFGATCEHHEAHRHFSITRTEADDVRSCPDCTAAVYVSCTGCGTGVSVDACPVREAVTREVTGKGGGDE